MKNLLLLLLIPVLLFIYISYTVVNSAATVINAMGNELRSEIIKPGSILSTSTGIAISLSNTNASSSGTVVSPSNTNTSSLGTMLSPSNTNTSSLGTMLSPSNTNASSNDIDFPPPVTTTSPDETGLQQSEMQHSQTCKFYSENDALQGYSETDPQVNTITLSFVGDCTIGDDEAYNWNTFREVYDKVNDPSYFFCGVKSVLGSDDFTFANLEGTFTTAEEKADKEYRFKGAPSYCDILVQGSVEGVTLANNHTLDYFDVGFEDTVKALDEAGIGYTHFETSFIKEIHGIKIGFLGYKAWGHEKKSNTLLVKQVKEMREMGVHFIVANYHWGDMKQYTPNDVQKRMAYFAIDHGVDLVIGHHPHVIQGMEIYKGKNILYSLGNFCYGGSPNPGDKDTIIYQHILSFDASSEIITSTNHKIIPARISSSSKRNNYQPVLATGDEGTRIMEKFLKLSAQLAENISSPSKVNKSP